MKLALYINDHHFEHQIHFGDLSYQYIPVSTSVPTYGTPICSSVSERKKRGRRERGSIGIEEEGKRGSGGGRKKGRNGEREEATAAKYRQRQNDCGSSNVECEKRACAILDFLLLSWMGPTMILFFIIFIQLDQATRNGIDYTPAHARTDTYHPFCTILYGTTVLVLHTNTHMELHTP